MKTAFGFCFATLFFAVTNCTNSVSAQPAAIQLIDQKDLVKSLLSENYETRVQAYSAMAYLPK